MASDIPLATPTPPPTGKKSFHLVHKTTLQMGVLEDDRLVSEPAKRKTASPVPEPKTPSPPPTIEDDEQPKSSRSSELLVLVVIVYAVSYEHILETGIGPLIPQLLQKTPEFANRSDLLGGFLASNDTEGKKSLYYQINVEGSLLWVVRPLASALFSPFLGYFIDKFNTKVCFVTGSLICTFFTVIYAFDIGYTMMVMSRIGQGIGGMLTLSAALSIIPYAFFDPGTRSRADAAISLGLVVGRVVGVIAGPCYEFLGRAFTFILLAFMGIIDVILRLMIKLPSEEEQPASEKKENVEFRKLFQILKDPLILCIMACKFIRSFTLGIVASSILQNWAISWLGAHQWQISAYLGVSSIVEVLIQAIVMALASRLVRWQFLLVWIALVIHGASVATFPCFYDIWMWIIPESMLRVANVFFNSFHYPLIGDIANRRHQNCYGLTYSITLAANKIGLAVAGFISGPIVNAMTLQAYLTMAGIMVVVLSPMALILVKIPSQADPYTEWFLKFKKLDNEQKEV